MSILKFPAPVTDVQSTTTGTGLWTLWKGRLKEWVCRQLNWIGVPGAIQDVEIEDEVSGQSIRVRVGILFTRITVNGRDYYFHRLSGKLDGTGEGCR